MVSLKKHNFKIFEARNFFNCTTCYTSKKKITTFFILSEPKNNVSNKIADFFNGFSFKTCICSPHRRRRRNKQPKPYEEQRKRDGNFMVLMLQYVFVWCNCNLFVIGFFWIIPPKKFKKNMHVPTMLLYVWIVLSIVFI